MADKKTNAARKRLLAKTEKRKYTSADFLSTGSDLLDLGCSGRKAGGFAKGHYYYFVGDSSSGKTFVCLTCFAEAAKNINFDNYRLIYDNGEDGALMSLTKFFGQKAADRIEPPAGTKKSPVYSEGIEEFYFHLDDAANDGRPFIYVQDSLDVLSSKDEEKKFKEAKSAYRKGKDAAGSYGDGKAKKNSVGLRQILPKLRKTGSILILIGQTRDNIGFGSQFEPQTRAGGRAPIFYATLVLWSSVLKKLKKKVREKERQIGIICRVKIKKNRFTGRDVSVNIPIYWSHGIDNTGSLVDFLVEEGHWKVVKGQINAVEFGAVANREDLIKEIEEDKHEKQLRSIVANVWRSIENELKVERKPRYE